MSDINDLKHKLTNIVDEELVLATLSGKRSQTSAGQTTPQIDRVHIRPMLLKGSICYQCEELRGPQSFHKNLSADEVVNYIVMMITEQFSQLQVQHRKELLSVLCSKKGKLTIKSRSITKTDSSPEPKQPKISLHNRQKQYILKEGTPIPFLIDLGVMTRDGRIVNSRYDKFRQINRFLEFVRDILPSLSADREITIIDFGCGKSYLTFAIYYYLHELNGMDVRMIGLDLKKDVIEHCNRLAQQYGYDKLSFHCGDIARFADSSIKQIDMVITLHACDTATDYALAKAVGWNARCILSVPCCQHELNRQLHNYMLAPVLEYGILKERMAALMTDGIRAQLLEQFGYKTQILEFIDMSHTPKNLLIRAVYDGHTPSVRSKQALHQMLSECDVHPTLERLLYNKEV